MLLALPVPLVVRFLSREQRLERGAALEVPVSSPLASFVGAGQASRHRRWPAVMLWLVWGLAVLASARPQHVGDPLALPISGRDLLLAVDLSGSMEEQDFELNGTPVNRL